MLNAHLVQDAVTDEEAVVFLLVLLFLLLVLLVLLLVGERLALGGFLLPIVVRVVLVVEERRVATEGPPRPDEFGLLAPRAPVGRALVLGELKQLGPDLLRFELLLL